MSVIVSNTVRAIVWAVLIIEEYTLGLQLNTFFSLPYPPKACLLLGVLLLGVILRASAVTGRYLRVYGGENPSQKFSRIVRLIDKGSYSCMRNPMHFFLNLTPVAIGLLTAKPGLAYIAGPLETIAILAMAVLIDERESIERFGEAYLEYRRRVPAINLNPRCL